MNRRLNPPPQNESPPTAHMSCHRMWRRRVWPTFASIYTTHIDRITGATYAETIELILTLSLITLTRLCK